MVRRHATPRPTGAWASSPGGRALAILVASRLYRQIGRRLLRRHGGDPLHGRTVVPHWERAVMVVLGLGQALDPRTWRAFARSGSL